MNKKMSAVQEVKRKQTVKGWKQLGRVLGQAAVILWELLVLAAGVLAAMLVIQTVCSQDMMLSSTGFFRSSVEWITARGAWLAVGLVVAAKVPAVVLWIGETRKGARYGRYGE